MSANTFDAKFGAILAIGPFMYTALATTTADNTDMYMAASANIGKYFVAPGPGSVLGISLQCAQATGGVTASFVKVRVHKDSTEIAVGGYPSATLNVTNGTKSYGTCRPGLIRFAAGDCLGLSLAGCDATLMPTASIIPIAHMYVALDPEE